MIYRSNVRTPLGKFTFAVDSQLAGEARHDIITAAVTEFKCAPGLLRVDQPVRSNRRIIARMWPVKHCQSAGQTWAWFTP